MSVASPVRPHIDRSSVAATHQHVYSPPKNRGLSPVVPLRLFLGLTFVYAAVDKIADPGYLDPLSGGAYLGNQLQSLSHSSPIGLLIKLVALPQVQIVGIGIMATELVLGLLVVAGVLTRPAAVVGALLSLTFFLTVTWNIQPYFLAPDSMYAVAWLTLALVGDAGAFSLEPRLLRQRLSLSGGQRLLAPAGAAAVGLIWLLAILPKSV